MTIFAQALLTGLQALDIEISAATLKALEEHWRLVAEYDKQFNLTAIRGEEEAAHKHYLDSLLLLYLLEEAVQEARQAGQTLYAADIGSGAGFPGLVLALACPKSEWLLLEAGGKKCGFLRLCLAELNIKNASALALRAEEAGQTAEWRGQFSLVTARAVAALPVLLEYALPLLKVGGTFLAAKGPALPAEETAAAQALAVLGAEPLGQHRFTLPGGEQRIVARYRKLRETPAKYPRRPGMPEKRPL
jgi:16S rRNA (guanine527-N7)-methyltransferase